jgi:hypothetical protein
MFDDQHTEQDLMFRSILENGQEEVPARVWDGVASGLDHMARRRKIVLWWSGVAASVAAAVAVGVVLNQTSEDFTMPGGENMVALVEAPVSKSEEALTFGSEEAPATIAEAAKQTTFLAYAPSTCQHASMSAAEDMTEQNIEAENQKTAGSQESAGSQETARAGKEASVGTGFTDWKEDERAERRKIKAALVLSSNTGANGAGKTSSSSILRRPANPNSLIKTGITEIGNNTFSMPLSFGIGAKIDLTPKWSIGVGVNYTLLSRRFEGDYLKIENETILEYTQSDIRNLQHYIGIPVNAYYNIVSKDWINFYTYAGGAVEKCVMNKFQVLESKSVHKEKVQGVQWSANLGIGVEFMVGKHVGLYIDPSARYYFNCGQPKSIRTSQPLMFGMELGLRTRF